MRAVVALACCSLIATTACATETGDAETASLESELASKKTPGVDVAAEVVSRSVATPTYGYDPQGLFLTVRVSVEDSVVRERRPGFDGLERPFALVTVIENGAARSVRVALPYAHSTRAGYYGQRVLDVYETTVRLDALAIERGVAVGVDTNVGTLWAQEPGDDFPIAK